MKEIILVTASWCHSCHAMLEWFPLIEIPGITLRSLDAEDPELSNNNISSVPIILFKTDGELDQTITNAVGKQEFLNKVKSIWPDIFPYYAEFSSP